MRRGALIQFPAPTYRDADVPDGSMTGLQILHSNQSLLEVDSREQRPIGPGQLCTATTGCYCQRARNVGPSSFSEFLCKKMITDYAEF